MATVTRRIKPKVAVSGPQLRRQSSRRVRILVQLSALTAAIAGLWLLWDLTASTVEIEVDGVTSSVQTHRRVVGDLLTDVGLLLGREAVVEEVLAGDSRVTVRVADRHSQANVASAATVDDSAQAAPREGLRISHNLNTRITDGLRLFIERPQPFLILADGRETQATSWAKTPAELMADAGIPFSPRDQVLIYGTAIGWEDTMPTGPGRISDTRLSGGPNWEQVERVPVQIEINRSVRLTVYESKVPYTIHTLAETVGEALRDAQITIYLGDEVQPRLGSQVSSGLRVFIRRSTPVSLLADGVLYKTRTQSENVGDVLTEIGVGLTGLDEVSPPLSADLYPDMQIQIVRVREEIEVEDVIAPFGTAWVGNRDLPIDTIVEHPGAEGITRRRFRVVLRDGQVVERELEDVWVAQEPRNRVREYGQKIEPKTFVTEDGQEITYWRTIRMRATSYSASTAGVSTSEPWYGYTRTGDRMRKGVVAVDPRIIPLRTKVYVPGYGFGDALDTGGNIQFRRIDLGYDDHNLVLWSRWVDVYLLWPPPPEHQIEWVIRNWPIEPQ
ncbi:MAG: ubiquitin-like domain-containing protein [Caldilineaceae bacterium]|nr:ubiquitin-like domain-containing protein [Caldilineaceae bacterium]MDE0337179.1 ubiquitin-like domain-containing protein [Caldilineaceae bacterium]